MRGLLFSILFCYVNLIANSSSYINIYFGRTIYKAADKNWGITNDSVGRMYFANDTGLLEYDGVEWKLYKLLDNSVVRSVFMDNDRIYTGSFEEFGFWDRKENGELTYNSLSIELEDGTFNNDDIWKIIKYQDCIYFQSFQGLYVYDGTVVKRIEGDSRIFSISVVNDDLIIQELSGPLYKVVNDKYLKIEGSDFLKDYKVQACMSST